MPTVIASYSQLHTICDRVGDMRGRRRTHMAHPGFAEPDDLQSCVKSHTPAVDAPFEWREDEDE